MTIKWKTFRNSFPNICDKCGTLANTVREYCESCSATNSFRTVTKDDYANYLTKNK